MYKKHNSSVVGDVHHKYIKCEVYTTDYIGIILKANHKQTGLLEISSWAFVSGVYRFRVF